MPCGYTARPEQKLEIFISIKSADFKPQVSAFLYSALLKSG